VNGSRRGDGRRFAAAGALALAVVAIVAAYAHFHTGTGRAVPRLFFSSTLAFKVWASVAIACLAVAQVVLAIRLYRGAGAGNGTWHRLAGTVLYLLSLPVVFHCVWSIGVDWAALDARVRAHAVAGCAYLGLFAAKVVSVRSRLGSARHLLPVLGSALALSLVVATASSAGWYLDVQGVPR
jgi:hypothetical protein